MTDKPDTRDEAVEAVACDLIEIYGTWPEGSEVRKDAFKVAAMLRALRDERNAWRKLAKRMTRRSD